MQISIEISLYPLAETEFKTEIWAFIKRLRNTEGLRVITNGMSTQVFGEYDEVMGALTNEIRKSFELPHSVFIIKIINADLQK